MPPQTGGASLPGQGSTPVPGGQASLEKSKAVPKFMASSQGRGLGVPARRSLAQKGPFRILQHPSPHQCLLRWAPDWLCSLRPVAAPLWAWVPAKRCQARPPPSPAWRPLRHCLCLAQLQTAGHGCHMLNHVTGSGWGLHPTGRTGASAAPSPCPSGLKPPGEPEQVWARRPLLPLR